MEDLLNIVHERIQMEGLKTVLECMFLVNYLGYIFHDDSGVACVGNLPALQWERPCPVHPER